MDLKSNDKKRILDFPVNRENPFIDELILPTRRGTIAISRTKDKGLLDIVTGEIDDGLFIAMRKEIDKEEFVKIFQSQLKVIFDLSKSALKTLSYFMNVTNFSDELDFDLQDCMIFTGYTSKESIFNSIAELLEKEIIARGKNPYKYYANPKIFYKGDRILLVNEYRIKRKKDIDNPNQIEIFENGKKEKIQSDSES